MRAGLRDGGALANRGHRVLQSTAVARVHVYIASCDGRQTAGIGEREQFTQARFIVAAAVQFDGQPSVAGEVARDPGAILATWCRAGDPQRQHAFEVFAVRAREPILALGCTASPACDDATQRLITGQGFGEQDQMQSVGQANLGADDQRDSGFFGCLMRAHDSRETAFVGDGKCRVALRLGTLEQLARGRRAAQERERRQAVQFGVTAHANHPCSSHGPSTAPTGRNAQAICPTLVSST